MSTYNGTEGPDTYTGGDDSDDIQGNGGNDTLNGGAGNDQITGGAGADKINGGSGNDTFYINAQGDIASGERYTGGTEFDTVEVTASGLNLNGIIFDADVERLYVDSNGTVALGAAQLDGFSRLESGAITINQAGVADLTNAAIYTSTFNLAVAGITLTLTGAYQNNYTINGSTGVDTITGSDSADFIFGDAGNDILNGGAGNDQITGGAGADKINGGSGNDTFYINAQTDVASGERYAGGTEFDTVEVTASGLNLNGITFDADVERLVVDSNGTVALGAAQLDGFSRLETGALTINQAGVADLTNATIYTSTFNLSASGVTLTLTGAYQNNYTINGSTGVDTITGSDSADFIFGDAGNDILNGGAGNDQITGGAGADKINGGSGNDTFFINAQGDVTSGERYAGGTEFDTVEVTASGLNLNGITFDADVERLVVDSNGTVALGAAQLDGFSRLETGTLTINQAGVADLTNATIYTSTFNLSASGVTLTLTGAYQNNYTINGSGGTDTITGSDSADFIFGNAGSDILNGGAGNDQITGGTGADKINGGSGNDTFTINAQGDVAAGERYTGGTEFDTVEVTASGINLNGITFDADVERLYVDGYGTVALGAAQLDGFSRLETGTLTINQSGIADLTDATIYTSTFNLAVPGITLTLTGAYQTNYTINGSGGTDTITGSDSADTIFGNAGSDILNGGAGNDQITGGTGADKINGGGGNDTFYINAQGDVASGERYTGGTDFDTVEVTAGGLNLNGITFDADVERLVVDGNGTVALGAAQLDGFSRIESGAITINQAGTADLTNAMIYTNTFNLSVAGITLTLTGAYQTYYVVNGSTGTDTITGSDTNDTIYGNAGNDILNGGAGNDQIIGGAGADRVNGGSGNDTFYIDAQSDVAAGERYTGGTEFDTIEVTAGGINLAGILFDADVEQLYVHSNGTVALTASQLDGFSRLQTGTITINGGGIADLTNAAVYTSSFVITSTAGVTLNLTNDYQANYTITGGNGNDVLTGGTNADTISGGGGDDIIEGGPGSDTLDGGDGFDIVSFSDSSSSLSVDLVNSIVTGGDQDSIANFEGAITGSGNDTLLGDDHDNYLDGGTGDDAMTGGLGNDTYVVRDAGDIITENADEGTDLVRTTLLSYTLDTNFENLAYVGTGDFTGTGNAADNAITGGMGNDRLDGLAGADTLSGGAGNDSYVVDALDTVVELADEGIDTVETALAAYTLGANVENLTFTGEGAFAGTGNALANTITAGGGDDLLVGGKGNDTLNGGEGIDTASYAGASGAVTVNLASGTASGADGSDTLSGIENLIGGAFNDTLTGDANANLLDGGAGADTLKGGDGDDVYIVDAGDKVIEFADGGIDTVRTGLAAYTLSNNVENLIYTGSDGFAGKGNELGNLIDTTAAAGADTLFGYDGNDTLTSGAGDDTLDGGDGDDVLDGGADFDTASFAKSSTAVVVNLAAHTASGQGSDTLLNIEAVIGSRFSDTLVGDGGDNMLAGGAGNDTLDGGSGDDVLDGGTGTDTASYASAIAGVHVDLALTGMQDTVAAGHDTLIAIETVIGSDYDDVLFGNDLGNTLRGGLGDDLIRGGLGNDVLVGGDGFDTLLYDTATSGVTVSLATTRTQDTLGAGIDALSGFEGIIGSAYDDQLTGGSGDDRLDGAGGNDLLQGGLGNDMLIGGAGIDTASYAAATAGVTVDLSSTIAQNTIGAGTDTLSGIENLLGSRYADTLTGDGGDNMLSGGSGNDILNGGGGADVILGGLGADILTGGAGSDRFVYTLVTESRGSTVDRITDFDANDSLDLTAIDANTGMDGDQAFTRTDMFHHTAGELILVYNTATQLTTLSADVNGDGVADFSILFNGNVTDWGSNWML